MTAEEYLIEPCKASSLPFWKTEQIEIPGDMQMIREDCFDAECVCGHNEPFFKRKHDMRST